MEPWIASQRVAIQHPSILFLSFFPRLSPGHAQYWRLLGRHPRGIELRVLAVDAVGFVGRQARSALARGVLAVPPVAGEGEGLGVGVRADVDEAAEVGLLEDDHVVGELPIAALDEVVAPRFLQDARRPGAGVEDRVVVDVGTIDADERDGDALDRILRVFERADVNE